jgi:hypothetical protein
MSWIDKELKKRVEATRHSNSPADTSIISEPEKMAVLWRKLEAANNALPPELKLAADFNLPAVAALDEPRFLVWFKAPNGAGLGFTGDAIRYVWPEINERASYNFWIRWTPDRGYRLGRRVFSPITGPKIVERSFSERRADFMIKCMVVGRRVTPRAIRKKRLWLF